MIYKIDADISEHYGYFTPVYIESEETISLEQAKNFLRKLGYEDEDGGLPFVDEIYVIQIEVLKAKDVW